MQLKYIPNDTMTREQQKAVDIINTVCLAGDPDEEFDITTYAYSAPEDGMFLAFEGDRIIGRVAVHKVRASYNGCEYTLGGFGGLAVLPEYQGNGYGRALAEAALEKYREIGVDVVCMEANIRSCIADFYQRLGFRFLSRPAYFINHGRNEVTDDNVMLMGLLDKPLGEDILTTDHKFCYGDQLGHW